MGSNASINSKIRDSMNSKIRTMLDEDVASVLHSGQGKEGVIKIGIIGGTGFENPSTGLPLDNREEIDMITPYGKPSELIVCGTIKDVPVALISRHGREHKISPTNVNFRANVYALKKLGCTHLVVATACGSLREEHAPGDLILIDQFIDRTTKRDNTFYDGYSLTGVGHLPVADPFDKDCRDIAMKVAKDIGIDLKNGGTMVTIEGPRFSTRAESHMFRAWGADLINMTTVPEAPLAMEAGLVHMSIACATDYDCWRGDEHVDVAQVIATLKGNAEKVTKLWTELIPAIAKHAKFEQVKAAQDVAKNNCMGGEQWVPFSKRSKADIEAKENLYARFAHPRILRI